jgi:hypothetical protein
MLPQGSESQQSQNRGWNAIGSMQWVDATAALTGQFTWPAVRSYAGRA